MKATLTFLCFAQALALTGCRGFLFTPFYLCEFRIRADNIEPSALRSALASFAAEMGFQLFFENTEIVVFGKPKAAKVPPSLASLEGAREHVVITLHRRSRSVFLEQRDSTVERPYIHAIKQRLNTLLKNMYGESAIEVEVGVGYEDPLA